MLSHFKEKFRQLDSCPYEIYINFMLKFGEAYGYFTLSQILVIFLHEEFEVGDVESGMIYGFWGAAITFWGFTMSCFNDYLGVRRSLLFGFMVSMVSNLLIAVTTNKNFLYFILFGLLPIGNSIGIPMLTIGIKRYTTKKNRGFAYGLFYAVMNVAALVSGPVIDFFNVVICPSNSSCSSTYRRQEKVPNSKMKLWTGNRLVIWTIVFVYCMAWLITFFYLREIKVDEDADRDEEQSLEDEENGASPRKRYRSSRNGSSNTKVMVYSSLHVLPAGEEEEEEEGFQEEEEDEEKGLEMTSPLSPLRGSHSPQKNQKHPRTLPQEREEVIDFSPPHKKNNKMKMSDRFLIGGNRQPHRYRELDNNSTHSSGRGIGKDGGEEDEDDQEETEIVLNPLSSQKQNKRRTTRRKNNSNNNNNNNLSNPARDQEEELAIVNNNSNNSDGSPRKITSPYSYVFLVLRSMTFWRFCLLTLFLINLNTIFRHVDATLPTYLIRCFGANYPKGIIYSINPFMIIWLTPTVAAFTSHWPHFDMIKYGGYVSALSPFFVAFSTSTWAVILFMVTLSLGEAIWSPRLYDYTMSIAPEGREASFSALAALPLFAAKIPVGMMSGYLLHTYLPENDPHPDGRRLWLIIALLTL
jgi:hypothetical protein